MYVKQVFNQTNQSSGNFQPVDDETIFLTEEETKKILRNALHEKIAKINSQNYLRAVNSVPVYKIPNYHDLYEALTKELIEVYKWDIDQYNEFEIDVLSRYFSNDQEFESMGEGFSLKKGLLLFGPTGCGKTTILNIMSKNPFTPFTVVSCRKISDEYAQHGHAAIGYYSKLRPVTARDWFGHGNIGYCFDDLGTENNKKNFGNESNVMQEVILNLYDAREGIGHTHLTTNISAESIFDNYGERVTSRMKEMFNVIEFQFDAPDRRK